MPKWAVIIIARIGPNSFGSRFLPEWAVMLARTGPSWPTRREKRVEYTACACRIESTQRYHLAVQVQRTAVDATEAAVTQKNIGGGLERGHDGRKRSNIRKREKKTEKKTIDITLYSRERWNPTVHLLPPRRRATTVVDAPDHRSHTTTCASPPPGSVPTLYRRPAADLKKCSGRLCTD